MIHKIINKILGDQNEKELKKIWPIVKKINQLEENYQQTLSEADIIKKTEEFKHRLKNGETVDQILPEAFALVKFACRKLVGKKWEVRGHEITWDIVPFDVQILGGIVLHQGKIAEMRTGEGKTFVCTMPAYLNALEEKGVHLVTVNDYLAHRDAEWMGGLYRFLGLNVGVIVHDQPREEKKAAYQADITYGTNNEYGFDYLRDNMSQNVENIVQRELHYAIVDEVDSILIDEARTPLIISSPAAESTTKYVRYAQLVKQLEETKDFVIDEKLKTATLTEAGIAKMEQLLGVENIYTDAGFLEVHHLEQALKAQTVYKNDIDYVVKDGEIIIVDEFTGRLMAGRRYSDGLHQAIEAKEGVEVKRESKTFATITFQNYFRLFKKLAGMTGTAQTEAEEFLQIYGLETLVIPTNRDISRIDAADMVFKNQKGKYLAVAKTVKELHDKGQPVLIGTISIEKSEIMSKLLSIQGVPHNVLNAKYHEKEAEIVAKAGQKGAVTIATNMAGRGTDIKLGEGVKDLGGLVVIGTERHESRRIDNQLRGRSGRQGDPGLSQFYVSMEDDLMRLFGSERIQGVMEAMKVPDDMPIQNKWISNSIESAQKKVEGRNFDIRKHLVEYDDVMNKHREIIYSRRRKVLHSDNIKNDIIVLVEKEAEKIVLAHTQEKENWHYHEILADINAIHRDPVNPIAQAELEKHAVVEDLIQMVKMYLFNEYEEKEKMLKEPGIMRQIERGVYLNVIDTLWMEHIDNMQHLREAVSLRGYAQRDPLISYKEEGYEMFTKLIHDIQSNTIGTIYKIDFKKQLPEQFLKLGTNEPAELRTNAAQIEEVLSGHKGHGSNITAAGSGSVTASTVPGMHNQSPNPVVVKATPQPTQTHQEVGRNEPCPCGSGKKYKKCHGSAE
ncbi:MAG: preprotein translocase subunit SecA [Candidatus Gracilibacteria bacterium]